MKDNKNSRHFLQSESWIKFQESQNKKVIKGSGSDWSVNALLESGGSGIGISTKRIYAPYGPSVQSYGGLKKALEFLVRKARDEGATYVRIEPTLRFEEEQLRKLGCVKAPRDYQPALTNIIDLTKDIDTILYAMNSGVRRLSRQYEQRGFKFNISFYSNDMDDFLGMMGTTAKRSEVVLRESSYLKAIVRELGSSKEAAVAYLLHNDKPISGVLFCDDIQEGTRYYLHAGSYDEARKLSANPALGLFLILDAKNKGFKKFDFCGVSPIEEVNHKWSGFSAFKRSFGGEDVAYSGTWEIPVNKVKYNLMRILRALRDKLNFF